MAKSTKSDSVTLIIHDAGIPGPGGVQQCTRCGLVIPPAGERAFDPQAILETQGPEGSTFAIYTGAESAPLCEPADREPSAR